MDFETLILLFLVGIVIFVAFLIGNWAGKLIANKDLEKRIQIEREDAIKRSRSTLTGQISEQLAPFLPDFPYKAAEARFIGKPIDFLIFKGMDEKDIQEVVFVEVKYGSSTLTTQERKLRDAIVKKRVRWEQYNLPKGKE